MCLIRVKSFIEIVGFFFTTKIYTNDMAVH